MEFGNFAQWGAISVSITIGGYSIWLTMRERKLNYEKQKREQANKIHVDSNDQEPLTKASKIIVVSLEFEDAFERKWQKSKNCLNRV